MILKITDKNDRSDNKHPVRFCAEETDRCLSEFWRSSDLVAWLSESVDGREMGLTPQLSETVYDIIDSGILPFTLEEILEKTNTGVKEGSSNVTAIHVLLNNTLRATIQHLADSGQLDAAMHLFENLREESDPDATTLVAYTIFTYSKGWLAEQIITDDERFSKLWITNDQAGQDVRFKEDDDEKQIKSMPTYASGSPKEFREAAVEHFFYQWTADGMLLSDVDDANAANKMAAKEAGLTATCIKKSTDTGSMKTLGRPARALWW